LENYAPDFKLTPSTASEGLQIPGVINLPPEGVSKWELSAEKEWEARLGRVAGLVRHLFGVDNVFIRLVGADGNWIRMESGSPLFQRKNGEMLCDFTLNRDDTLQVSDVDTDPRIASKELLNDASELKSYVGHSLESDTGEHIGVLCAWNVQPRTFNEDELALFEDVVFWVQRELMTAREFLRAAKIQRGLLPNHSIELPGYDIKGYFLPANLISGDFYDWYESTGGMEFSLADVMGKGVGAAILAATVRAVLRAGSRDHSPGVTVGIAAEILDRDFISSNSFVTLVHGRLDAASGVVTYADAGHGLSLLIKRDGTFFRLASFNLPLGTGLSNKWEENTVSLEPGDTFMSVSDGILEIFDGTLDGIHQMGYIVNSSKSAQEIIDQIAKLAADKSMPDDIAVLVLRRM
jgi:hypothetical protein